MDDEIRCDEIKVVQYVILFIEFGIDEKNEYFVFAVSFFVSVTIDCQFSPFQITDPASMKFTRSYSQ